MTNLPTISVPDELMPRIMAAFNSNADTYRSWLRKAVRDQVVEVEQRTLLEQQEAAKRELFTEQRDQREAFAASVTNDLGME